MSVLERLARAGHRAAAAVLDAFDPDQPRDENGMWASSGGGGRGAATTSQHESAISLHSSFAEKARSSGNGRSAALHERARQAHLDVVHKETGKGHLLGSQRSSVEELRAEAQRASAYAHEEDKNPTKGFALAYSTKEKPSTRPSDPVHGGSGRRTPYNRKEGTARERKELRETRSMEAAAKIFAKPGQTSLKQDFVSRSRPIGSGVKK